MNRLPLIALATCLCVLPAAASAKDDYVYGPAPAWSTYKALGEAALRPRLPGPDGWKIEWPNGYKQGFWVTRGHPHGYITCGIARAVKPFQGGFPVYPFVVVIDQGVVKEVDFEAKPRTLPALICPSAVANGAFPTAAAMETGSSPPAAAGTVDASAALPETNTIAKLGITVRTMPEGAYVTSVEPGSPAGKAGLVPGTVIIKANGIALANLGAAMTGVLSADTPELAVETATGSHLILRH